jgi:hypothetical protein
VLHAHERSFSEAGLSDDKGRRPVDAQLARIRKAGAAQTISTPPRRGIESSAIGRFAGDRTELAELTDESVLLRGDEAVEFVVPRHGRSMPGEVWA